jgi:hypothetical protein
MYLYLLTYISSMEEKVLIHGTTVEKLSDAIAARVMEVVNQGQARREYGMRELAELTGYTPAHLRVLLRANGIPFRKTGKLIYVSHENLSLIPRKSRPELSDYSE